MSLMFASEIWTFLNFVHATPGTPAGSRSNDHSSIESERLDRYGYARQDFADLDRCVGLMQVAHGSRENSRHAGTAAPRPATEVNRHRKLLSKFKQRRIATAPHSGHT